MGCTSSQVKSPDDKRQISPVANNNNNNNNQKGDSGEDNDGDNTEGKDNDGEGENDSKFFYEMESDSDEVKLDPVEKGYPDINESDFDAVATYAKESINLSDENPIVTMVTKVHKEVDENNQIFTQDKCDQHARNAPDSASQSFEELIAYLDKQFKDSRYRDIMLVRAILVWLSNQNIGQVSTSRNTDTPVGYLSLLSQGKTTYSTFFTVLCREGNIVCAQIHGIAKAGEYQPGDTDDNHMRCLWNAVYIQNKWRIVHPFWSCRAVFGKVSGGWINVEAGGQYVRQRVIETSGILKNAFHDYYIMPKPNEFLYACHPDDSKWQLIKNPITRLQFLQKEYLLPPFWKLGMELITEDDGQCSKKPKDGDHGQSSKKPKDRDHGQSSKKPKDRDHDQCSIKSKNGEVSISFRSHLKVANELDLWYELLIKENISGEHSDLLNSENIPKLVSLVRDTPQWNCKVQFPTKGIYRIVFYAGKYKQQLLRIAEFKLVCEKPRKDCQPLPFNPGRIVLGPGPAMEECGLLLPSHKNGLVIADRKKSILLRFLLDSDIAKTLKVKTELVTKDSMTDQKLQQKLNDSVVCAKDQSGKEEKLKTSAQELRITIKGPFKRDCYLRISTSCGSTQKKNTHKEDMTVVCNYYITQSDSRNKPYESGHKRFLLRNLLQSIEGDDMQKIEKWIDRCEKENNAQCKKENKARCENENKARCEKAKIAPEDPGLEYARRILEVLTLRTAIHDANMRRRLGETETTIQQIKQSTCERIFRRDVQILERCAEELRSLRGFTQKLPQLLNALLELCDIKVPNDIVETLLTAVLVLFGKKINPEWEYDDIRIESRRLSGNISNKTESDFTEEDAIRVRVFLDKYRKEETQACTLAATTMYTWIDDVTRTILQDIGEDQ